MNFALNPRQSSRIPDDLELCLGMRFSSCGSCQQLSAGTRLACPGGSMRSGWRRKRDSNASGGYPRDAGHGGGGAGRLLDSEATALGSDCGAWQESAVWLPPFQAAQARLTQAIVVVRACGPTCGLGAIRRALLSADAITCPSPVASAIRRLIVRRERLGVDELQGEPYSPSLLADAGEFC
jgi:hypothetical protein